MAERLKSVMLIDDNKYDNFYHERVIRNSHVADSIIQVGSGAEALRVLDGKSNEEREKIDLIFVDLNMPGMDGWEFLEQYYLRYKRHGHARLMVLTASDYQEDMIRARYNPCLNGFIVKPLTREIMANIAREIN